MSGVLSRIQEHSWPYEIEGLQGGLLTLHLLLGRHLGGDRMRDGRIQHQPGHLVRVRAGVGQRHLWAVADAQAKVEAARAAMDALRAKIAEAIGAATPAPSASASAQ